ncbi:methyltransferase domain-containing protein [Streptomyces sp. TLI_171]|uniref:methyltransferase domain-containing protein n=1 Tax=Streptomyces sp. TLI_171 TaxID=1938859 RepID=UPI000C17B773|nr:methyltransferase domain-containing protein [Streptomyces sp. TLI_171]RKE16956.1 methyltransferase family protein [Streptomyces sp. TLI_171]
MTSPVFETVPPDPIAYLDRLAVSELGREYKATMLAALAVEPGHTVVDLGCGPGTDLPALAEAVGSGGTVLGVDHDREAVDTAADRTAHLLQVSARLADLHELPLADASCDRARTDRVLQHVADPSLALREARRVLRPGGLLVLGEPDWGTLTVDHPDAALTAAYTRYVTDHAVRNGRIGSQLPRLAAESGLDVVDVHPITPVFRQVGPADLVLGLQRVTRRAVAAGYFSAPDADRWLTHLATGPFLATVTFHVVTARA